MNRLDRGAPNGIETEPSRSRPTGEGSSVSSAWRAVRDETPDIIRVREQAVAFDDGYAAFYRAEFPHVVRTSYLIVHDRQRAEEVAQEAFIQLLVHWGKVSRYQQPGAWVRRVAIRIALRTARRDRLRPVLEQRTDPPLVLAAQDVDLLNAIKQLPTRQRAAVALFYFEDRPVKEIADILACSESTAKAHLFKARGKLAQLLREDEGEALDAN